MATVTQRWTTGTRDVGTRQVAVLHYIIEGTDDLAVAHSALEGAASSTYDGIALSNVKIAERLADQIWAGTVSYGKGAAQLNPAGSSSFSFDIAGQAQHISHSKATSNSYAPVGVNPPNHKGAINVSSTSVDGTDIQVPVYSFSETHIILDASITDSYKADVFSLVGTTNDDTFKGFAAGELLFLGASGSLQGNETTWEIRYAFAGSPNATGLTIGDITGIAKGGWEYLWVQFNKGDDENQLIMTPRAAYAERVYDSGDFDLLGI